jgi:hypothetical protein
MPSRIGLIAGSSMLRTERSAWLFLSGLPALLAAALGAIRSNPCYRAIS